MKSLKLSGIALAMLCTLLLIGIQNSDAIKIIEFPSDTEDYSYNDYTYHMASVRTDKPIYHVSWYIDEKFVYGETLDSSTNRASYSPYRKIPGNVKGKKYKIGVKVWEWDADAKKFRSTTDSYVVRMFQPIYTFEPEMLPKKYASVTGYAKLRRQYYDGSNITIDCYVSAFNSKGVRRTAYSRFRHTLTGRAAIERNHPLNVKGEIDPQRIGPNFGSYSHTDALTHYNVGPFEGGRDVTSDAYIRLVIGGFAEEDHYLVGNSEDFNYEDEEQGVPND